MPIPQQHPIPMQPPSYLQPCPTTPSTDPFTSTQLQVLDTCMQALEHWIIDGITNTLLTKLQNQHSTVPVTTTAPPVPDLIDMNTMVTPPTSHSNPTQYSSFANPSNSTTHTTVILNQSSSKSPQQNIPQPTVTKQVHTSPTSSSIITIANLAKIMSAPKEVTRPLAFPSSKSSSDYNHWKQLCILKASKHLSSIYMTVKHANKLIFNPEMSSELSSTLFLLTTDALGGAELVKLYGSIDIDSANRFV
jgi:hypothetical protein